MKTSCGLFSPVVVLLLVFILSSQAGVALAAGQAGENHATLNKVVEIDERAWAQLQAGKYEAARETLWGAIGILNDANLGDQAITAQIHAQLAVVYLTGFNDRTKAIRQFVLALKINPNIVIVPQVETPALDQALAAARSQVGLAPQAKTAVSGTAPAGETPSLPVAVAGATPASGTIPPSLGTAPNLPPPSASAEAPSAMPIGEGAAPMNALPLPGRETSATTAPTLEDQARLEEINRQAQIDEEWRKYHHRRPAGWGFISMGGGAFAETYHGSVGLDSHDTDASGRSVQLGGGFSPAKIFQFVPEAGYQFNDKFALSLQFRFQLAPPLDSVGWFHLPGVSDPPTYALALFLRAQYALLTAGDFQAFGSGVAGFGLVGGRTFLGYVPRTCEIDVVYQCPPGTVHSDTVSGGPVAVGAGLGVTYHVARFFSLWAELRGISSFGPAMLLIEVNTGVAFAFPVAPSARR